MRRRPRKYTLKIQTRFRWVDETLAEKLPALKRIYFDSKNWNILRVSNFTWFLKNPSSFSNENFDLQTRSTFRFVSKWRFFCSHKFPGNIYFRDIAAWNCPEKQRYFENNWDIGKNQNTHTKIFSLIQTSEIYIKFQICMNICRCLIHTVSLMQNLCKLAYPWYLNGWNSEGNGLQPPAPLKREEGAKNPPVSK